MKKVFILLTLVLALFFTARTAQAADLNVICNSSGCSPSSATDVLFQNTTWFPGASHTTTIQVENTSGINQKIAHAPYNIVTSGGANVAEVIDMTITRSDDSAVLWTGTLQEMFDIGEQFLDTLPAGEINVYEYVGTMQNVGNEYKNVNVTFDMLFGFQEQEIAPTTTPTNTPSSSSNNTGNDGSNSSNSSSGDSGGSISSSSESSGNILGATAQFLQNAINFFSSDDSGDVFATDENERNTGTAEEKTNKGEVEGATSCTNKPWWKHVIIGFFIIQLALILLRNRFTKRIFTIIQLISAIATMVLVYLSHCSPWEWIVLAAFMSILNLIIKQRG